MNEKIQERLSIAEKRLQKQQAKVHEHQLGILELAKQSPDMILSAMPAKLQNMQEAMNYLEMLQYEIEILQSISKE